MNDYNQLLLLMKVGFSGILFVTGFYGLFVLLRNRRSPAALLSLPAFLALVLISVGVLLAFSDHKNKYDFLNLVKFISGIFTLVYGVYATLSDFYEEDENGRRVIRRVGLIGITLFFSSTILSISADHVKRAIEKQVVEKQKKYLESIVDKIVVVDKSTGEMNVNFRRFSDQLFTDIKKANGDLQLSREALGICEGRRGELEREMGAVKKEGSICVENLETRTRELSSRTAELEQLGNLLRENRQELRRSGDKLIETEGRIVGLQKDIKVAGVELNRIRESHGETLSLVREREREIRELSEAREKMEKRLVELELQRTSEKKRLADANKTLRELRQELERRTGQFDESRKTIDELVKTNRKLMRLIPSPLNDSQTEGDPVSKIDRTGMKGGKPGLNTGEKHKPSAGESDDPTKANPVRPQRAVGE